MQYKVIFEKGKYALILRGLQMKEYAVVYGLNKKHGDWSHTCNYCNLEDFDEVEALSKMIDYFRMKTEPDYIPYCRLEELATQFKDGLIADDKDSAMEYFDEVCEMTEEEKKFFGIKTESEE